MTITRKKAKKYFIKTSTYIWRGLVILLARKWKFFEEIHTKSTEKEKITKEDGREDNKPCSNRGLLEFQQFDLPLIKG
jgi:hypothetical protein